jgi:hypothetical protein
MTARKLFALTSFNSSFALSHGSKLFYAPWGKREKAALDFIPLSSQNVFVRTFYSTIDKVEVINGRTAKGIRIGRMEIESFGE